MPRRSTLASLRRPALLSLATVAVLAATASPALAGPPWVSIELPANPLDATTRDAYLVVHTYHHANVMALQLTGRAIGIVDGQRRSIDLSFARTSIPGAYALRRSWPAGGAWVLAINAGGKGGPTALVGVGADGEVRSVKVPRQSGESWGRPVTDRDIDAALQAVARADEAPAAPGTALAGLAVVIPLALGIVVSRRRRAA